MIYNKLVESCFFSPKHVGIIDLTQRLSVHYRAGDSRSDIVDFYLLGDKKGLIMKACFKAYGNPYLIAGAEWICQQLEGSLIAKHGFVNSALLVQQLAISKHRYSVALQLEDGYQEVVRMMKVKLAMMEKEI